MALRVPLPECPLTWFGGSGSALDRGAVLFKDLSPGISGLIWKFEEAQSVSAGLYKAIHKRTGCHVDSKRARELPAQR